MSLVLTKGTKVRKIRDITVKLLEICGPLTKMLKERTLTVTSGHRKYRYKFEVSYCTF